MTELPQDSAPFDPTRYTAQELDAARRVITWLYRPWPESEPPDALFDPAQYSRDELVLAASVIALRKGPPVPASPPKATITEEPSVEWQPGDGGAGGILVRSCWRSSGDISTTADWLR